MTRKLALLSVLGICIRVIALENQDILGAYAGGSTLLSIRGDSVTALASPPTADSDAGGFPP